MTLIGHQRQLGWLGRELPQVTLLQGPESTGKRVLARHLLAGRGGVALEVTDLTADEARRVAADTALLPFRGRWNIIIDLDGATGQAQNILLKTLEEPGSAWFVLTASVPPLPTVRSRCAVIPCGLLTDEQVREVLLSLGVPEHDATACAPFGCGQVAPALEVLKDAEGFRKARSVVSAALRAALSGDGSLLSAAMRGWEPAHTTQLGLWAVEASSGRWHRFDAATAPGASREQARTLLALLSRYAGARTAAAVALDAAFPLAG